MENITTNDIQSYTNFDDTDWGTIRISKYKKIANLVLVTPLVFIADVDCCNLFTKSQALENIRDVESDLGQDYRVYETFRGLRVFDVSSTLDLGLDTERELALNSLKSLRSDPKYIYFCEFRRQYAARLSPKQNRPSEDQICELVKEGSLITNPAIFTIVKMHDDVSLNSSNWCNTWRSLDLSK